MMAEAALPWLLLAQAVMGGLDTLVNHEWLARLAHRPSARRELALHSVREASYGTLFIGLALFEWHGSGAWVIAAVLVLEALVTATDEFVENRTRVLPQNERVMHVFLTINYGVIVAALAPLLLEWVQAASGLQPRTWGWRSYALAAFGVSSFAWSLRDLLAWRRLARGAPASA